MPICSLSNNLRQAVQALAAHRETHPHIEFDIFVRNSLHVKPDGGDGCDRLSKLQLVQDG